MTQQAIESRDYSLHRLMSPSQVLTGLPMNIHVTTDVEDLMAIQQQCKTGKN